MNMTVQELWDKVNNAVSHQDIRQAQEAIWGSNVDCDTMDDLLNALAYKSRELYREGISLDDEEDPEEAAYLQAEREGMQLY